MTKISFILLLLLPTASSGQHTSDSVKIIGLLKNVEHNIQQQTTLSYSSSFKQITSGRDDSIIVSRGQLWLSMNSSDTIFGSKFHISGVDAHGDFDYYYDGQNGYDIRHSQKEIIIFNPYAFPNDSHNPAKMRMSLEPMDNLLTDKDIIKTLLDNKPKEKLIDSGETWIIELSYPEDEYSQVRTRSITISKKDNLISNDRSDVLWSGAPFHQEYIIEHLSVNRSEINDHIALSRSFNNYIIKQFSRPKEGRDPNDNLLGTTASNFEYPTFDGKQITLNDLRGKYVLLDFWESWCGNCILTIPEMLKLYDRFTSKGLVILGITTENKKEVTQIIDKNKITYPTLMGDERVLKNYNVNARPTYVFIDPEGHIIHYFYGLHKDLTSLLESTLK